MTKHHLSIFAFAILFIIAAMSIRLSQSPDSLCSNLQCIRMLHRDDFLQKELYMDSPTTYRALYQSNARMLRIDATHTPNESSDAELTAAITRMKALFEKAPAPYPGDISDAIVCDPAFAPTFHEIQNGQTHISYFEGFLNSRMIFGSCSVDQAVYTGIAAYTYCPKQSLLLRIELFSSIRDTTDDKQELTNQIRSLECEE